MGPCHADWSTGRHRRRRRPRQRQSRRRWQCRAGVRYEPLSLVHLAAYGRGPSVAYSYGWGLSERSRRKRRTRTEAGTAPRSWGSAQPCRHLPNRHSLIDPTSSLAFRVGHRRHRHKVDRNHDASFDQWYWRGSYRHYVSGDRGLWEPRKKEEMAIRRAITVGSAIVLDLIDRPCSGRGLAQKRRYRPHSCPMPTGLNPRRLDDSTGGRRAPSAGRDGRLV